MTAGFDRSEYRQRQTAFAAALAEAGLPGAVVFSRGGGTLDRYADILYLTGFYQGYGYLPETENLFSGRAHAALVIDRAGTSLLCVAVPEHEPGTVVAGEMRASPDFSATVAAALGELGLDRGEVGLVGGDVLPHLQSRKIAARLPDLAWHECDELLHAIRRIKSPAEMDAIRRAAGVHVAALEAMQSAVAPGRTEADLVAAFGDVALRAGAGIYFTSVASGPEVARWSSRALPGFSTRPLQDGDMLRFDTGIVLDGYLSDFGRTMVAGREAASQRRLLDTLHAALDATLDAIAPGRRVSEVVATGEAALAALGVAANPGEAGSIYSSFPVHWGHGLGMGWERPMMTSTDETLIRPGMYLAIERTLGMVGIGTAAAEQTLLVTEDGIEILSAGRRGRWS